MVFQFLLCSLLSPVEFRQQLLKNAKSNFFRYILLWKLFQLAQLSLFSRKSQHVRVCLDSVTKMTETGSKIKHQTKGKDNCE